MNRRCAIVASGPSARGFVPPPELTIIAVNGAIEWIPRADFFFTLDWSDINQRRLRQRRAGTRYFAAYPIHRRWNDPAITWLDRLESVGPEPKPSGTPEWWLWRLCGRRGLSERPGAVHAGNSAYGALGLAYLLGFDDVALVGVDASGEERVEGGFSRHLSHLPLLFASAVAQVRVVSCGAMGGIPQMTFPEWLSC